ncbi:MAG: uroporphyrinogen-III synthase [Bacteroidota bacterium]
MGLQGKTVLITRAETQMNEFAGLIKKNGGTVISFPTIQIKPPSDWDECDRACSQIENYHGVIFTSVNSVEFFLNRYLGRQLSIDSLKSKLVCAVGEKTRQALHKHEIEVAIIPDKFTSDDLAKVLTAEIVSGKRFLFPRGNLGKNTLIDHITALGGEVHPVIVYLTQKTERRNVEQIRQYLQKGEIDIITFTSPSTAINFFELFPDFKVLQKNVKLAAIGPVTASAIEKIGNTVDITAKDSTIESMVETINEFYNRQTDK